MLTSNIKFKNFQINKNNKKIIKILDILKNDFLKKKNQLLLSLSCKYKYSFEYKNLKKYKKFKFFRIIGMGGSILGTQAIYSFLKFKIKKIFFFTNNLDLKKKDISKNNQLDIFVSKSGNTLETISNLHILKKKENLFL